MLMEEDEVTSARRVARGAEQRENGVTTIEAN